MLVELDGKHPQVAETAFIAPTAVLIGDVTIGEESSVWYGAVLRSDQPGHRIVVGVGSSIQDNCVLHVATDRDTVVGDRVTVGHGAKLEGCTVQDGAVVGMNCVLLEGAVLGAGSLLGANSTLLAGTHIPPDVVAAGSPAVVKKEVSGPARWWVEQAADHYLERTRRYRSQGLDRPLDER